MKAIYYEEFGPAEVLQLGDLPRPEPGPGQVLVEVAAAGVNPIDRRLRNGELQEYFEREFPIIPGWDLAGRIVETGEGVEDWSTGDEVLGLAFTWFLHHGTYAEYAVIDTSAIARKPESLSFLEAAALPLVSLTAWQSLAEFGQCRSGQTVLIQAGAGGVGSAAIPMARYLGATVYTTAREANFDYVRALGADHVIDYTREDYAERIRREVPEGLDLVLESLTGEAIEKAIGLVKDGGVVAYMNNDPPDLPEIATRGIKTDFLHHRADGESLAWLAERYADGTFPLPQIEALPLEEAREAHRRSESGRTRGKLVLRIRDPGEG